MKKHANHGASDLKRVVRLKKDTIAEKVVDSRSLGQSSVEVGEVVPAKII